MAHDYQPATYRYAGITTDGDRDLITNLIRYPRDDRDLTNAEALTPRGWRQATFDWEGEDAHTYGVPMDAQTFGLTASALIDDKRDGVIIEPATASHIYAIVDPDDTSAIVTIALLTTGPAAYRRNGGKWQPDETLLESLLSAAPPPLVELDDTTTHQVIAQIDANSANQLLIDRTGHATLGPGYSTISPQPTTEAKQLPNTKPDDGVHEAGRKDKPVGAARDPENRPSRTPEDSEEGPDSRPLTAALVTEYHANLAEVAAQQQQRLDASEAYYYSDIGYAAGFNLTDATARIRRDTTARYAATRREALTAALRTARQLRARETELTNVLLPATTSVVARPRPIK